MRVCYTLNGTALDLNPSKMNRAVLMVFPFEQVGKYFYINCEEYQIRLCIVADNKIGFSW